MVCVLLQQEAPLLAGNLSRAAEVFYAVLTCSPDADPAMSSEPDDTSDGLGKQNDTGGLPEQHSHLDAPSDGVYMICGVLIAMLLVGLIIVLLAVTISKLRKRDENHHSNVHPQDVVPDVVLQTTTTTTTTTTAISTISQGQLNPAVEQTLAPLGSNGGTFQPQFLWQYPAQYSLYSNDQETLVHSLPAERPGFCRGFRKNLRGRWRRLVKRKPAQEAYTIPAELRDQLKQIYVY